MAVPRTLRRLVRVRAMEEEQSLAALEAAAAAVRHLEQAMVAEEQKSRDGRRLTFAALLEGDASGRIAGLQQVERGATRATLIVPALQQAEGALAAARAIYLACRVERRQAQSLLDAAEARAQLALRRREQRDADEGHLRRRAQQSGPGEARATAEENTERSPET